MAHIVEFSIKGLVGRNDTYSQRLDRNTNIFFGGNGSGKTSLLKILQSALLCNTSTIERIPFESATVVVHSDQYNTDYVYSIEKRGSGLPQVALFEDPSATPERRRRELPWRWSIKPSLPGDISRWQHTFLPVSRILFAPELAYEWTRALAEPTSATKYDDFIDKNFERSLERTWVSYSARLQASIRASQQKGLQGILADIFAPPTGRDNKKAANFNWDTSYNRLLSFLRRQNPSAKAGAKADFEKRVANDPVLVNVLARINRVEAEIEQTMAPVTKMEELMKRTFGAQKQVVFGADHIRVTANENLIPLSALSSGEKHILRLFLEAIQVEESSLIIDEPELSLHIDWQRELVNWINQLNPEAQLICATHSPEIMADIEDANIFRI